MVKTRMVQVGDEMVVFIPDALIQQLGLQNQVLLEVQGDAIIVRARPARFGWEEQFANATLSNADKNEEVARRDLTNTP